MKRPEALERLRSSRSGHLATIRPDGRPHIVVVTFAVLADRFVVTVVDHKPKTTERLQRLANIEHNPAASFLVDRYSDDWERLWWVRADGEATVLGAGPERDVAVDALIAKYVQYGRRRPAGPVIRLEIADVTGWSSTERRLTR